MSMLEDDSIADSYASQLLHDWMDAWEEGRGERVDAAFNVDHTVQKYREHVDPYLEHGVFLYFAFAFSLSASMSIMK